jgi:hypothetical protein
VGTTQPSDARAGADFSRGRSFAHVGGMHSHLGLLRAKILHALGMTVMLGGCCTERTRTETTCIELGEDDLSCPDVAYVEEELGLENVTSVTEYPQRPYLVDGERHIAPTECCYDSEETYTDCGGSHGFGRPLVIDGAAAIAEALPGDRGWWRERRRALFASGLSPVERAERARQWRKRALLEHAAVGSFARFALELLGLGAPMDLVRGAQRASLEEIAHASACFELAFALDGLRAGPGPLPVAGAVVSAPSAADVARRLVHEGCVEETLGAAELLAAAGRERDPFVRRLLVRLGRDESRHAAFGWQALAWLVGEDAAARAAATEALSIAERSVATSAPSALDAWRAIVRPVAETVLS